MASSVDGKLGHQEGKLVKKMKLTWIQKGPQKIHE